MQNEEQGIAEVQDTLTTEGTVEEGETSENGEKDQEVVENEEIEKTTNTVEGD